jgi:4-amino-4-deoxy-L-arabinose transferase-like glycosyltransferase
MRIKRLLLLGGIFFVAAFFRFYNLSFVPPSPSLDEVSIGYNAYSILLTGKDEYGVSWPLLLRAYDDFRPALYVYFTIPFVWLFGVTAISVRLPSVILSLITVYVAYRTGKLIGKKYLSFDRLGDITAAILAISPWHIYISRLGHEANLGLTLVALGIYFLLQAVLTSYKNAWIFAAVAFGLSVHGYQSQKIISPLLLMLGGGLFWKELWHEKQKVLLAGVVGLIIALPAITATLSPQGMVRFRGTSAFSQDAGLVTAAREKYIAAKESGNRVLQIIHSRYITNTIIFSTNYLSHFSPQWLFWGREKEAHKVPGLGLMYLWELPFLLLGLWAIIASRLSRRIKALLLVGIFISPIPASITTQAPHAMRAYTFIPFVQIVEALGMWWVVRRLSKQQLRIFAVVIGMVVSMGLTKFWQGYFVRFPLEQSDSFQYAMADAVTFARSVQADYRTVEFSHQGALYQSYMFFLFYTRFDPHEYLRLGGTISGGYEEAHIIDKYAFGMLPVKYEDMKKSVLYFYDSTMVPEGARVIRRFVNAGGKEAIVAAVKQ